MDLISSTPLNKLLSSCKSMSNIFNFPENSRESSFKEDLVALRELAIILNSG